MIGKTMIAACAAMCLVACESTPEPAASDQQGRIVLASAISPGSRSSDGLTVYGDPVYDDEEAEAARAARAGSAKPRAAETSKARENRTRLANVAPPEPEEPQPATNPPVKTGPAEAPTTPEALPAPPDDSVSDAPSGGTASVAPWMMIAAGAAVAAALLFGVLWRRYRS
jgi:hypothetical protein